MMGGGVLSRGRERRKVVEGLLICQNENKVVGVRSSRVEASS